MKKHIQYFRYLVRHKWFVLLAGLKVGVSPWRLIKHDWSKFLPCEWFPYVESFYGVKRELRNDWRAREMRILGHWITKSREEVQDAFNTAWLHHQHLNDHHWQHWVLREDSGSVKVLDMPLECVAEMIADWAGAGRAITGKWEVSDWYDKNREKMQLSPKTSALVEAWIESLFRKPKHSTNQPCQA